MNTLKITNRNRLLTERHDLEQAGIWELEIEEKKRKMYSPCNLNLVIDRRCYCDCGFCFFRGETAKKKITDVEYLSKLEAVLERLKGLPIEITITGGEPSLCPERLIPVMEMVKRYGFSNRTFSTNGAGLLKRIAGKPLLQYMKENGCIYNINLSRMSTDDAENGNIFHGNTIDNEEIKQIAVFAEANDLDFRLSCNLLNDTMNSWAAVKKYMKFYENYGITSFLFREIVPKREHPVVADIVKEMKKEIEREWVSEHSQREEQKQESEHEQKMEWKQESEHEQEMEREQGSEQKIELIKTAHGMFYDVDIYGYREKLIKHYEGKTVNTQNKRPDQSGERLITFLVYEEGELRTKW